MSSATDVVRASYEAVNRGNVEAAMEALTPDAEWHESGALPEPDVHRGRDAIAAFLTDFLAQWESFDQEIVEVSESGDKVGVFIHLTATGRGSSIPVDARYAHIWTMRDGLAIRVDAYYEESNAREALASA
ncbi:MAG: nuclear transport factor 2 family protein [Solirubrobacterales bacterium]